MREVDDAVRQDQIFGFWRRYGIAIAGAIVVGLAAFAGWLYWQSHSQAKSGEIAEELGGLLDVVAAGGKPDAKKLDALIADSPAGYRATAMLAKAAVATQSGDAKGAVAVYKAMQADSSIGKPWRDLALVRQTAVEFDQIKPEDVVARMKPFAAAGDPWFGSAGEMTAIAYMKMGKNDLAGPVFAAMAKDEKVPRSLRSRAGQMAGLLGIDTVDTESLEKVGNGGTDAPAGG